MRMLPLAAAACALLLASPTLAQTPPETVATFDGPMPTGITVASSGRIFVNFPRWGDEVPFTVAEIRDGKAVAYPDAAINRGDTAAPAISLLSVQSVVADGRNRLWIVDTAAPQFRPRLSGGAKLVAVDLATDKVVKTIVLPDDVALPTTYINDVRLDLRPGNGRGAEGVAYITDSSVSGPGGLIVVDIATGKATRRLSGHPSTMPDLTFQPIVEGRPMLSRPAPGQSAPFRVASDGIALSADGATLYFCPLSSRHLYSVPTAALLDPSVSDAALGALVKDLGIKGASDGLEADDRGRVYASDYENNAVHRLENGAWTTIAKGPAILWPDTLSVGPDHHLYFTANQLQRSPGFNEGKDLRQKPYHLFRIPVDAGPVLLK